MMSSSPCFLLRNERMKVPVSQGIEEMLLSTNEVLQSCPQEGEEMPEPGEWSPLSSADNPLSWLAAPCRGASVLLVTLHWGCSCSQGCFQMKRLWWPWWGFHVMICLVPSTSDQLLSRLGQGELLEAHQGCDLSPRFIPSTYILRAHFSLAPWIQVESLLRDQKWPYSQLCGFFSLLIIFLVASTLKTH